MLPNDFPHFKTVYGVFRHWKLEGIWERMNTELRRMVRQRAGKNPEPTAAILDSQSVKSAPHGGQVGYDAAKRIKGRERHILVDTLGLLLGIDVTEGDFPEREGGFWLFNRLKGVLRRLRQTRSSRDARTPRRNGQSRTEDERVSSLTASMDR